MTQKKKENVTTAVAEEFVTSHLPTELYKEFEEMMQKVRMHSMVEEIPSFVVNTEFFLDLFGELIVYKKEDISIEVFDKVRKMKLDIEFYEYYLEKLNEFFLKHDLENSYEVRADSEDTSNLLIQMPNPYRKSILQTLLDTYEEDIRNQQKLTDEMILLDMIISWVKEEQTPITWESEEVSLFKKHLSNWLSQMNEELDKIQSALLDFSMLKDEYINFSIILVIDYLNSLIENSKGDYEEYIKGMQLKYFRDVIMTNKKIRKSMEKKSK